MSEEDKLNKKVAEAVEVAANEAAKREIDELTEFEHAVDEMLASGYLDDTLRVIDTEGVAQVLPVLDSVRESGLPAPVRLWPRLRPRPKRPSDCRLRIVM